VYQRLQGDAGYQGVDKRPDVPDDLEWHPALRPDKRRALDKNDPQQALTDRIERLKASIRSKVEHVFRVVKCQFGYRKLRYRGLAKNGAQMTTLYTLANLWLVRGKTAEAAGISAPEMTRQGQFQVLDARRSAPSGAWPDSNQPDPSNSGLSAHLIGICAELP
jgi:hypothetical protein